MKGNKEIYSQNFLIAEQLLQNRGIRYNTVDEYERYSNLLPKTGKKLFEPKCSWLECKQLEKGLQYRSDLLVIERVERKSQIAVGEWLPDEEKVRVIKKSGQEWANFGTEVNSVLLLNPEEALSLLEMNSIELLWEKVPMSIQQAYDILLNFDKFGCSLENYKVYNQFVRYGYRLLRHCGNKSTTPRGINKQSLFRLKPVVISPHNGLRKFTESLEINLKGNTSNTDRSKKQNSEISDNNENMIDDCVQEVMENIVIHLESQKGSENNSSINSLNKNNEFEEIPNSTGSKKRKVFKNVNRLDTNNQNKRKKIEVNINDNEKQGQEVIYLSDDEIEEICKPITRLEVLNQLPDLASQSLKITSRNMKKYLPSSINLQKDVYYFDKIKGPNINRTDKSNNTSQNISSKRNFYSRKQNYANQCAIWNSNAQFKNKSVLHQINSQMRFHTTLQRTNTFSEFRYLQYYNNYFSVNKCNRNAIELMNWYLMRNIFPSNYRPNFCNPTIVPSSNLSNNRACTRQCQTKVSSVNNDSNYNRGSVIDNKKEPSTWHQFKEKMQDEQTITIDDENCNEKKVDGQNNHHKNMKPLIHVKRSAYAFDVNDKINLIKPFSKKSHQKKSYDSKISFNIYSNNANYKKSNPGSPNCQLLVVKEHLGHYLNSEEVHYSLIAKDKTLVLAYVTKTSISYIHFGNVEIPVLI